MSSPAASPFRCPTCGVSIPWDSAAKIPQGDYLPFCSQRCQWVDLHGWLNEEHALPTISQQAIEDAEAGVDWESDEDSEL